MSNAEEHPECEGVAEPQERPSFLRRLFRGSSPARTRFRVIGLALAAFLLFKYCLVPIRIVGFSMFPNYKPGEINYINRFAYANTPPQRGDVVSIGTTGHKVTIVKRVLGLPGETLRMRNGEVFVNGEKIDEPYLEIKGGLSTQGRVTLAEDEYWVVGDNRMISEYLKVHPQFILGRPLF